MSATACASIVVAAIAFAMPAQNVALKRVTPSLPPSDADVPAAITKSLGPDLTVSSVFAVPNVPDLFVVVGDTRARPDESDFGLRFVIVARSRPTGAKEQQQFVVVNRGLGAGDSYMLKPMVFVGGGRTFLFGEIATEYPWGFAIFEIDRAHKLVYLGVLDVLLEDPNEPNGGNGASAGPVLSAAIEGGKLVVEFEAPVVLEELPYKPGMSEPETIRHTKRGKQKIAFAATSMSPPRSPSQSSSSSATPTKRFERIR